MNVQKLISKIKKIDIILGALENLHEDMIKMRQDLTVLEMLREHKGMKLAEVVCQMHLSHGMLRSEVELLIERMIEDKSVVAYKYVVEGMDRAYAFLIAWDMKVV